MDKELELRMYGFVNYQLTGIQKGIQFAHAIVEYGLEYSSTKEYKEWANNHKTVILLNGGTTNTNILHLGTMNILYNSLIENEIPCSCFHEPDLGDQMSAIAFIVDERVFNRDKYPDFKDWLVSNFEFNYDKIDDISNIAKKIEQSTVKDDINVFNKWLKLIGGKKNAILRDLLKNKQLA